MRLTVAGEFGEENFSDFLTAIIKDRKLIELDTWKEACKYFRDNKECVEATTPATIKRTVPADVDMDEYAYMLENADKSEPFRNKLSRRIDPSLVIPAVRVKEVEPEIVEEEVEEVVEDTVDEEIVEAVSTEEVVEDVEVPSNASDDHEIHVEEIVEEEVEEVVEDTVDEEIVEAVSTEEVVEDVEVPSNASDDHEIHVDLGRRREAIRNIERQELEAERVERLKQEEADKLNDPVERAKKAVDELKKEISEVEEDTDYDEVVEEERVERLKQEEADKLNDPVERAKKAVDELKKEISEVEEDTDYDEVVEETVEIKTRRS